MADPGIWTMAQRGPDRLALVDPDGRAMELRYDVEGNLSWKKDLGHFDAGPYDAPDLQWGFASSPTIYKDRVIVLCDARNASFITALDIETGEEVWRTQRKETSTWGTPTVHESDSRTQVIVNGWKHIGAYDVSTGKELWKLTGGGDIPVPTPVVADNLVYITNAHGGKAPIYAIRTTAIGDITLKGDATSNQHIAWSYGRRDAET